MAHVRPADVETPFLGRGGFQPSEERQNVNAVGRLQEPGRRVLESVQVAPRLMDAEPRCAATSMSSSMARSTSPSKRQVIPQKLRSCRSSVRQPLQPVPRRGRSACGHAPRSSRRLGSQSRASTREAASVRSPSMTASAAASSCPIASHPGLPHGPGGARGSWTSPGRPSGPQGQSASGAGQQPHQGIGAARDRPGPAAWRTRSTISGGSNSPPSPTIS